MQVNQSIDQAKLNLAEEINDLSGSVRQTGELAILD